VSRLKVGWSTKDHSVAPITVAAKASATRQYARLVSEWVGGIGLDPLKYATRSTRRTKATLIYRRTGNLRAVQLVTPKSKAPCATLASK
jgi:hypothetical protein